jgi:GT2 family glycosyltransferase
MFTVIVCSQHPAKFKAVETQYARLLPGSHMVHIADAQSLCEGYNRGVQQSAGEVLIFAHDDVEVLSNDLREKLERHLQVYDVIGIAGTSRLLDGNWLSAGPPYLFGQVAHAHAAGYAITIYSVPARTVGQIQAMDGLFFVAKRTVVDAIAFDARTFDGFHCYDLDFTFSAHRAGFKLGICNDIHLIHYSQGESYKDPKLPQYRRRLQDKHKLPYFDRRRFQLGGVIVKTKEEVSEVMTPFYWTD